MVFSSFAFLFLFLPAVLVCYFLIPPRFRSARNLILLLFSLCFYLYGEPKGIGVMLGVIALSYVSAVVLDRTKTTRVRRLLMIAAIAGMVAVIGYYKYSGFAVENINRVLGTSLPVPAVIMPIGISFFTFQSMSYVIDVYRRTVPAQKNPLYVALYVSLFPQLVAGPIVRYETVAEEIITRRETVQDFHDGLARFIVGLGKKMLLANPLGDVATEIFALSGSALTPAKAWIGAILFAFQILFDFSGYSDMAIGMGRMFGFHFLENFNFPYLCNSITDFWRRWHISLSTWFRDYIYIPLGGNRKGKARQLVNIFVVWVLTGLWHGASWNFVLWGLYFALLLLVEKLFLGRLLTKLPRFFQHLYALLFVLLGWVIFNCTSLTGIGHYLAAMFAGTSGGAADWHYILWLLRQYGLELLFAVLLSTPVLGKLPAPIKDRPAAQILYTLWLLLVFILSLLTLANSSFNPFIYFRF